MAFYRGHEKPAIFFSFFFLFIFKLAKQVKQKCSPTGPAFRQLYSALSVLDMVTQLGVGPDIALNAAW